MYAHDTQTLVTPGRKDSMEAYVGDRHPALAPFTYLPHSETPGYARLYRLPFMANMWAVGGESPCVEHCPACVFGARAGQHVPMVG